MGRARVTFAAGMLAAISLTAGVWVRGQNAVPKYQPAALAAGGDIAYPMSSRAPGFVTLDVSLNGSAAVQNVSVIRDVPPLTKAAQSTVRNWQFTAATLDGQAAPGVVRVTVAFNPYNPSGVGLPGESLQPASGGATGDFQPAQVVQANYANYPPNTVAFGTVIMRLRVGKDGKVHRVTVLNGKDAGLLGAAAKAVKTWAFTAASYKGQSIGSTVVVAFVFASPEAGTR